MATRLILLAVIAVSVANGGVYLDPDSGPEDMHFPVERAINDIISKHFDTLYTFMLIKMQNAKELSTQKELRNVLDKGIGGRSKALMAFIDYAGSRGFNPDIDDPQPYDLSQCDADYGCWKVGLDTERDLYKALSDGYSAAGSHEDADAQAFILPFVRASLKTIYYHKDVIAKMDAAVAKKQPDLTAHDDDLVGGPDTVYYGQ